MENFFLETGTFDLFQKRDSKQVKMVSVTFYVLWFWSRSAPAPTQGPTSAGAGGPPPATKRLQQTQAQVDEVSGSRWFFAHYKGADVGLVCVCLFFSVRYFSSLAVQ